MRVDLPTKNFFFFFVNLTLRSPASFRVTKFHRLLPGQREISRLRLVLTPRRFINRTQLVNLLDFLCVWVEPFTKSISIINNKIDFLTNFTKLFFPHFHLQYNKKNAPFFHYHAKEKKCTIIDIDTVMPQVPPLDTPPYTLIYRVI